MLSCCFGLLSWSIEIYMTWSIVERWVWDHYLSYLWPTKSLLDSRCMLFSCSRRLALLGENSFQESLMWMGLAYQLRIYGFKMHYLFMLPVIWGRFHFALSILFDLCKSHGITFDIIWVTLILTWISWSLGFDNKKWSSYFEMLCFLVLVCWSMRCLMCCEFYFVLLVIINGSLIH